MIPTNKNLQELPIGGYAFYTDDHDAVLGKIVGYTPHKVRLVTCRYSTIEVVTLDTKNLYPYDPNTDVCLALEYARLEQAMLTQTYKIGRVSKSMKPWFAMVYDFTDNTARLELFMTKEVDLRAYPGFSVPEKGIIVPFQVRPGYANTSYYGAGFQKVDDLEIDTRTFSIDSEQDQAEFKKLYNYDIKNLERYKR